MIWFTFGLIVAFISLGWLIFAPKSYVPDPRYRPNDSYNLKGYSIVGFGIAIILILLSCFAMVGTKNVGVPTVFGKTTGETYGARLNFKAPWVSVTDIDGTVQVEEYKDEDCIYVKIADGGTACVSMSYRWRITSDGADQVYADYRNSEDDIVDAVKKALVSTPVKTSINEELGKFDPLSGADLTPDMTAEEIANLKLNTILPYKEYSAAIQKNVDEQVAELGGLVEIYSVKISFLKLPDGTQDKINKFNQAVQDTKIAIQQIATKKAQAAANEALAASLTDPNVLVSQCFDGLLSGDISNQPGFSCWPGGGNAVVVPGTK